MKNITSKIALFAALFIFTASAFAQKSFEFGLRYTPQKTILFNKSDKNAGAELDKESTTSFISGGIGMVYSFSKCKGISVDILYSREGQEYSGTNMNTGSSTAYNRVVTLQALFNSKPTTGVYQSKAELNYIKIPILFRLTNDNRKKHYCILSAGPQINYLSDAVYELNNEDVLLPGTNITPGDTYKKVTIDGVVAFGVGFNFSKHFSLSAQARFDYGFADVEKKNVTYGTSGTLQQKYYPNGRPSTHNASAGLMISFNYKL